MLLGELGEAEPLVLPAAPPELVAPALPLPVVLPLEPCSFRHFCFSAVGMLSQRLLAVPAAEAPVPAPVLAPLEVVPLEVVPLEVVSLEVVPVPALLGSELPELVALGLVVLVPEPLTPVLLEAPAPVVPVVPAPLEVPLPMVAPLDVPVLDLLVAPEPLSEAQPAPKATSAAAVAAASSFSFIRFSFWKWGIRARCAPGMSKRHALRRNAPCAAWGMQMSLRLAAGGAALLVAGAYARRRTAQALRANPPRGNFVEAGGLRLHYTEQGAGPPLVLLHGLGSMAEDFATSGFLERAAARYRVIAFDRPGYGHSDPAPRAAAWPWRQASLLREALAKLDVRRPIMLGHSWGTLVALAFALRYPGTLRSLVLASGYFFPTARPDALLLSPPAIPGIGDVLRYTLSPCLGRLLWPAFLKLLFSPSRPPPAGPVPTWLALRPAQLKAVASETLLTIPAAIALSRRYRELTLPLLIVAGANDRYVSPRSHSLRLKTAVPHSRLVLLPDAGHMLHHTHADAILSEIEAVRMPVIA